MGSHESKMQAQHNFHARSKFKSACQRKKRKRNGTTFETNNSPAPLERRNPPPCRNHRKHQRKKKRRRLLIIIGNINGRRSGGGGGGCVSCNTEILRNKYFARSTGRNEFSAVFNTLNKDGVVIKGLVDRLVLVQAFDVSLIRSFSLLQYLYK